MLNAQEVGVTEEHSSDKLFRMGSKIVSLESAPQEVPGLGVKLGVEDYRSYCTAQRRYKKSKFMIGFGWGDLVVGGLLYSCGVMLSYYDSRSYNGYAYSLYSGEFLLIGGILLVAGNVLLPWGYISKGVAAGKISRIAEGYNAAQNKGTELSLSMSPTLLYNHGQVAPGVGLTLSF